jgi:hypothetical protein
MQRIKRNAAYFTDRTKQNHWCDTCFEQLDPNERILLDDGTKVLKKELQELKNDALPEEGWVNCDECHSWVHQVSVFSHPLFVSVAANCTSQVFLALFLGMRTFQRENKQIFCSFHLSKLLPADSENAGVP